MSGFALFVVLYLANAGQMLVDPRVCLGRATGGVRGAGFLIVGWLLWRHGLPRLRHGDGAVLMASAVIVAVAAVLALSALCRARGLCCRRGP